MRRLAYALSGFSVLYISVAAVHVSSYWESCGAWDFCVIMSDNMHPWLVMFSAEDVAAFSLVVLWLLQTTLLLSMWFAVASWGAKRFGPTEAGFVVATAGCIPPFAVVFALWHVGVGANKYYGHPVLFWQEHMFAQPYLVVMMGIISIMATSLLLWAIGLGLYRGIQQTFANARIKGR